VKAYLKQVVVEEKKEIRVDMYEKLKDYVAEIRGILTRNNIQYKESEKDGVRVIELEKPTEVRIPRPVYHAPVKFTYTIVFEDPAEKEMLHRRIRKILDDGTVVVEISHLTLYLPQSWRDQQQVDVVIEPEPYGSVSDVVGDLLYDISRELGELERDYNITLRLKVKQINELKSVDANAIRDAIIKLFIEEDHVIVDKYEYADLKGRASKYEKKIKELREELEELEAKYNELVGFIKSKELQDEFTKFIIERENEEKEEEIKEKYSELYKDEDEE